MAVETPKASGQVLLTRKEGSVLWLILNRPEALNAFTVPLMEGLAQALKEAAKDSQVRAVVLTGAGRAFCVGQDLKEHLDRKPSFLEDLRARYNPLVLRIRELEKPVVAAVNGVAAGAGMSLALACDFRIMASAASFHPAFIKIGLAPDSGNLFFLGKYVGFSRALELAMTGRPVSAEEALAWGLVHKVAPAEELQAAVEAFLKPMVDGPARALALAKRMYNKALFAKDLPSQLDDEAYLQELAGRTQDHQEGLQAFLDKRPPKFAGTVKM